MPQGSSAWEFKTKTRREDVRCVKAIKTRQLKNVPYVAADAILLTESIRSLRDDVLILAGIAM